MTTWHEAIGSAAPQMKVPAGKAGTEQPIEHSNHERINDSIEPDGDANGYVRNIPPILKAIKGWVCWKLEPDPDGGKPRKVPYYVRGGKRHGVQGTERDRARLGTFDEALATYLRGGYSGLGLAILDGFDITALDFDDCVTDGTVDPRVEKYLATYSEISPSGNGVRAFFRGDGPGNGKDTGGDPKVEFFSTKGFVTVTGNLTAVCDLIGADVVPLTADVLQLHAERFGVRSATPTDAKLPDPNVTIEKARAMLEVLDPDIGHDDWLHVGMGLHHQFGDDGFELWNEWSSKGSKYPSEEILRKRWDSFGRYDGETVTIGTLVKLARAAGWVEDLTDEFEVLPVVTSEASITALFNELALSKEDVKKMADAEFLIPNMIVRGHMAAYVSPGNGGKTTIFIHLCPKLVAMGMQVLYINVDGSPGDLKRHFEHAARHGYQVVAPDAKDGKSVTDVLAIMRGIAKGSARCDRIVFILDTLKKFVDVIDKRKAKDLFNLLRALTVKGATICLLGHTNKHVGEDGKTIYEGTGDLRNDLDELIYLDAFKNESNNTLEVTTRPDKVRAEFLPKSFVINLDDRSVSEPGVVIKVLNKNAREMLDLIRQAITAGCTSQKDIVEWVKTRSTHSDKKIRAMLANFTHSTPPEIICQATGRGKDLHYSLPAISDEFEVIA